MQPKQLPLPARRWTLLLTFGVYPRLPSLGSTPILDANGTMINDKSQKWEYWRNYYVGLLNRPTAPVSEELLSIAQTATEDPTIDCSEPTTQEVINNLNTTKKGKAPGICNITPEMMKAGGAHRLQHLTNQDLPERLTYRYHTLRLEKRDYSSILRRER